jgi:hypothetical protein
MEVSIPPWSDSGGWGTPIGAHRTFFSNILGGRFEYSGLADAMIKTT